MEPGHTCILTCNHAAHEYKIRKGHSPVRIFLCIDFSQVEQDLKSFGAHVIESGVIGRQRKFDVKNADGNQSRLQLV